MPAESVSMRQALGRTFAMGRARAAFNVRFHRRRAAKPIIWRR
jgi:hypothetical protein